MTLKELKDIVSSFPKEWDDVDVTFSFTYPYYDTDDVYTKYSNADIDLEWGDKELNFILSER